jgi:hypothetical protein
MLKRAILLSVLFLTLIYAVPSTSAAGGSRGYCSCSCSLTRNCSTDADCGGGRCLGGPTCC